MEGWVMNITAEQQKAGAATVGWISQHLDNFANIIATKIKDGDLSSDDPRIQDALNVIAEGKKRLAVP
jgi:hypothetical protein